MRLILRTSLSLACLEIRRAFARVCFAGRSVRACIEYICCFDARRRALQYMQTLRECIRVNIFSCATVEAVASVRGWRFYCESGRTPLFGLFGYFENPMRGVFRGIFPLPAAVAETPHTFSTRTCCVHWRLRRVRSS